MKVLLTGGRAPATLELARVLHAAGHQVEVAESLPLYLCRFSKAVARHHAVAGPTQQPARFAEQLRKLLEQHRFDLLIPTCEETFWVAASGLDRSWCDGLDKLRRLHSKWWFQLRVVEHGLAGLESWRIDQTAALAAYLDGQHVIKPEFSRFAQRALMRPRNLSGLGRGPWVVQPFVEGRELCAFAIARRGQLLALAIYPSEVRMGQGAALRFRALEHRHVTQWVQRFVAAENYTGFIGFDFIETPGGRLCPLECNPRLTSGIHLLADRSGLAELFFSDPAAMLVPLPGKVAQLSQALLLAGHPRQALAAADVVFRREDPWPGWLQGLTLLPLLWTAWRQGLSLLEASTWDIEWNG